MPYLKCAGCDENFLSNTAVKYCLKCIKKMEDSKCEKCCEKINLCSESGTEIFCKTGLCFECYMNQNICETCGVGLGPLTSCNILETVDGQKTYCYDHIKEAEQELIDSPPESDGDKLDRISSQLDTLIHLMKKFSYKKVGNVAIGTFEEEKKHFTGEDAVLTVGGEDIKITTLEEIIKLNDEFKNVNKDSIEE